MTQRDIDATTPQYLRNKYAIVGVGETSYRRGSQESTRNLATWAINNALDDAGLEASDIDGMLSYSGNDSTFSPFVAGDLGIRLDEAEALVQRALKEEPFSGAYLDSLGWIYFKQGKLAASETTLRKAVERESHDATIHSHLGDLYAKMGRGDLAAAEWEKSLNEWRRSLPADVEPEKVAELEKKLSQSKRRLAQKSTSSVAKP